MPPGKRGESHILTKMADHSHRGDIQANECSISLEAMLTVLFENVCKHAYSRTDLCYKYEDLSSVLRACV